MNSKATEQSEDPSAQNDMPATPGPVSFDPPKAEMGTGAGVVTGRSPKRRRKERPCTRCIKRNIGHLCHDEPREHAKKPKAEHENATADEEGASPVKLEDSPPGHRPTSFEPRTDQPQLHESGLQLDPASAPQEPSESTAQLGQLSPVPGAQSKPLNGGGQPYLGYNDWSLGAQNQFQDMHTFHPSYMFNAPEVTNEYNLLNDFLSTSLLDDGALYSGDDAPPLYSDSPAMSNMQTNTNPSMSAFPLGQSPNSHALASQSSTVQGNPISRPASTKPNDKARETFWRTAADPSGDNDSAEDRMNALLQAKYDAGLLKPFNYVKGYARLSHYMEQNMQPSSRQKILRQLDKFRPKFRERMQKLTDIELVRVEMWFERKLMEYDRVFASMAIPACCWRRTGEIFRGNKEMAELVHVPIEKLRDGKVAIYEIIEEESIVSYWDKFGTIAFDISQKAMLTSCFLKNPDPNAKNSSIHCCFSFTIRRDSQGMWVLFPLMIFLTS
ncbi:MAG: hypothetical protein M1833_006667 [Piccolia ochrophora]|nr:MAG: hypothetical protein M1833_006667 [Piccolia ochrophora]